VTTQQVSPSIFKAYDIRGIVDKTLTVDAVRQIGRAVALLAIERGVKEIVVGRDGRLSGPAFIEALAGGINDMGLNAIDLGMVATPMVYYGNVSFGTGTGVMVTGSHNPPEYNGLKMVVGGETLYGDTIQGLLKAIQTGKTAQLAPVRGTTRQADVEQAYIDRIVSDAKLARPMKIVVDCGNGAPGAYVGKLYRAMGCEVTELFCEVDGNFPNHHPDPAHEENLQDLIKKVQEVGADVGLAFDGDGDRLGVVTKNGKIIAADRQLMLYARDVLANRPGEQIIYDVKCSRFVASVVREAGGIPLMWRTGHSLIKAKLKETKAPLAGEMSGHVFFNDRWFGFDDGLYTGARLLEILSKSADPSALLEGLPQAGASTQELHVNTPEGENYTVMQRLAKETTFSGATEVITIDGVRVEYADGFGLARPSNTTPIIVMRFEADNQAALERIQSQFKKAVEAVRPGLSFPF
jgi:phosphomannomutase / phosphoglucomutase